MLFSGIMVALAILAPVASSSWYKLGCFVDDIYKDLEDGPQEYGYNVDTCQAACSQYLYFALQNGGLCSCGNGYSTLQQYYQVDDSECGEDGLGKLNRNMIYGHVSNVNMDWKYWTRYGVGSSILLDAAFPNGLRGYLETKADFARPMNLSFEMMNIDSTKECGVLQLFPQILTRHSGYNIGVEWWKQFFGFGVDLVLYKYGYTTGNDWHRLSIELTETHVRAWYDGSLQGSLYNTRYKRGKIRIGFNCRNYVYRNFVINAGIVTESVELGQTVSPTSSPSLAPTTEVPSMIPSTPPTVSPSVSPTTNTSSFIDVTEDINTFLGLDAKHAEVIVIALIILLICTCFVLCIVCTWLLKKNSLSFQDPATELVTFEQESEMKLGEYIGVDSRQTEIKTAGEVAGEL